MGILNSQLIWKIHRSLTFPPLFWGWIFWSPEITRQWPIKMLWSSVQTGKNLEWVHDSTLPAPWHWPTPTMLGLIPPPILKFCPLFYFSNEEELKQLKDVAWSYHGGRTIWHRTIWHQDNLAPGQFGTGQFGTRTKKVKKMPFFAISAKIRYHIFPEMLLFLKFFDLISLV